MTSDSVIHVLVFYSRREQCSCVVWSRSEKPLPSHALGQMKWAIRNSQFLRKTLHKTVEMKELERKLGTGICASRCSSELSENP